MENQKESVNNEAPEKAEPSQAAKTLTSLMMLGHMFDEQVRPSQGDEKAKGIRGDHEKA